MKKIVLIMLAAVLFTGCSNNEGEKSTNGSDTNNQELNTEETDENDANNDESNNLTENDSDDSDDNSTDEHVEHQEGLKMGETGTVVDNNEDRYEVTLNSAEYVDTIAGKESSGETYAVVNITVKNIGDESFNAKDIFKPGFGTEGGGSASLNHTLMEKGLVDEEDIEQDLLEGEIAPGESVSGDHVFVVEEKADNYIFTLGGRGVQIITYANWDVSGSEVK